MKVSLALESKEGKDILAQFRAMDVLKSGTVVVSYRSRKYYLVHADININAIELDLREVT